MLILSTVHEPYFFREVKGHLGSTTVQDPIFNEDSISMKPLSWQLTSIELILGRYDLHIKYMIHIVLCGDENVTIGET